MGHPRLGVNRMHGQGQKQISPLRFAPVEMTGLRWKSRDSRSPSGVTERKTKSKAGKWNVKAHDVLARSRRCRRAHKHYRHTTHTAAIGFLLVGLKVCRQAGIVESGFDLAGFQTYIFRGFH